MTTRDWYQADDDDSDRARSNTAVWRDRGAIIAAQQTRIAQLEAQVAAVGAVLERKVILHRRWDKSVVPVVRVEALIEAMASAGGGS